MRSAVPARPAKPAPLRDALSLRREACPPGSIRQRAQKNPVVRTIATSLDALLRTGAVVASFPSTVHKNGVALRLDPTTAAGTAAFWMRGLHSTPSALSFSYSEDAALHATVGIPDAVDWFPAESTYGAPDQVDADAYELASAAGYAVLTGATTETLRLGMHAAAIGAGPCIFGAFDPAHGCAEDAGEVDFYTANSALTEAAATPPPSPHDGELFVVSAAPSFLLADLLNERDAAEGDSFRKVLLPGLEATIHQAALGVARQVRALADRRVLMLDLNSTSVGFYPKLAVADDGETLESTGYGYEGRTGTVTKGTPKVAHFGTFSTKFRQSVSAYNADASYLASMLSLLASTRAVHGMRAMELLKFAIDGRDATGARLPEPDLPENFASISLEAAVRNGSPHAETFASALVGVGKGAASVSPQDAEQLASVLQAKVKEDTAVLPKVVAATTGLDAPDCCVFAPRCEEEDAEMKRVRDALAKTHL